MWSLYIINEKKNENSDILYTDRDARDNTKWKWIMIIYKCK